MLETASVDANTDITASAAPAHSTTHLVTLPATDETTAGTASTVGTSSAHPLPATDETAEGTVSTAGTSSAAPGPTASRRHWHRYDRPLLERQATLMTLYRTSTPPTWNDRTSRNKKATPKL